jgi:ankyrin repeat protein
MSSEKQTNNTRDDNPEKHQAAEYNKFGWCQIHEASYKGFVHAVKRIVDNSFDKAQQLELFTKDENCVTPIVIAVLGGHRELVEYLVDAGANLNVRNNKGHGLVEIAAIRQVCIFCGSNFNLRLEFFLAHIYFNGLVFFRSCSI